jgi:hypothetical protein
MLTMPDRIGRRVLTNRLILVPVRYSIIFPIAGAENTIVRWAKILGGYMDTERMRIDQLKNVKRDANIVELKPGMP